MSAGRQDVYFIRSWRSGLVKIGVSFNPMTRLHQLEDAVMRWDPQTGRWSCGLSLTLLAVEPGAGVERERELHRRLDAWSVLPQDLPDAEWHAGGSSEWFRYEGEVRRHVEGLLHAP